MLLRIPNVLSPDQVSRVRARLDGAGSAWVDGLATAGYQGAPVKQNQQIDERSDVARELGDVILGALERNPLFISAALPNKVYAPMFNRYGEGMHFGNHVDGRSGSSRAVACAFAPISRPRFFSHRRRNTTAANW